MNLVIVESPAKAKTIERYLGKDFKVLASFGHVRDLPVKEIGIDIKSDFKPDYQILPKAKKIIAEIKKATDSAKYLYLATDLDREGEAISWHLLYALKIKEGDPRVKRIVFNEITKSAIEKAVAHPRGIDINLVDAQQARRVLDRLVGYKLSPLLWKKVKSGLSAGRVQSVAVRLVADREREIDKFKPEEFWVIAVDLSKLKDTQIFRAFLIEMNGKEIKKLDIKTAKEAKAIESALESAKYKVIDVKTEESLRRPAAPFVTSTLQMEASRKLGFSAKQTMMLAQKLYEAGHITYMRTDSTNISAEAVLAIRKVIVDKFGQKYLPESARQYQAKSKGAQEAHEAIRPTHFEEESVITDGREQRLYDLVWKRTVASQMDDAILDIVTAKISATPPISPPTLGGARGDMIFQAKGESIKFDGFIKVYTEGRDEEPETQAGILPNLVVNEELSLKDLIKDQKFTEPPKRYTEATLVKKLESLGIGRPSTYAPTLSTIQDRGYVTLEEKKFKPTEIGLIVNDLLVEHFANIVDYQFTAKMEDEFDEIAEGKLKWVPVIREFYEPFAKNLTVKNKEINKGDIIKDEATDEICPECGKPVVIKLGRFGKFMACSGFPTCKFSKPLAPEGGGKTELVVGEEEPQEVGEEKIRCDKCGGKMIVKDGRFGRFLACENYPKCKSTKTIAATTGLKCPDCGDGEIIERRTKRGRRFWGCSRYPKCEYATWEQPKRKDNESQMPKS